ncbi:MAG: T9SS type A sorting domain-containing protein, partial [Bacteroidales bacterium]|nr:T9SS type A sorting domain-containing protein [Bacteroidales bacterium]
TGINTNEISVNWGAPGQGWVKVTEENIDECISTTENYLVTIDECVSINEINSDNILIYPNPVDEILNIKINSFKSSNVEIKILDVMGRIMKFHKTEINNGIIKLNISGLHNGIYLIEIFNSDFGKITKRFIVN